jgi:sec-independent protein translocase protein TatA
MGLGEVLLIVLALLLLFGARRIPLIARGLGASIRNFKREYRDGDPDDRALGDGESDR